MNTSTSQSSRKKGRALLRKTRKKTKRLIKK